MSRQGTKIIQKEEAKWGIDDKSVLQHKVQTLDFPIFALVAYINFPDKHVFSSKNLLFQLPSIPKRSTALTSYTAWARLTQLSGASPAHFTLFILSLGT